MTGVGWRIAYSLGWLAATVAAVALSWVGVSSVLGESASGDPVVVAAPASQAPVVTAPARASASPRATASPAPSVSASAATTPTPSDQHDYSTPGGSAVLEVTATSVTVISVRPNDGFTSQVTNGLDWLRVDFLTDDGAHGWSVVASWYEHVPQIQNVSF